MMASLPIKFSSNMLRTGCFLFAAAARRYCLLFGMNLLPLSVMRVWLLRLCGVGIGEDCYIGFGVMVDTNYPQLIKIKDHVTISHGCVLITHSQTPVRSSLLKEKINHVREIIIDNGAWIGIKTIVLPGAYIPVNCLIGAGSVVPAIEMQPNSVYAGNPCRFKRNIISDESRATI